MRLERIWAQQEKDRQVAEALANFAAMQTGLKSAKGVGTHQTKPKTEETEMKAGLVEMKGDVGYGKKATEVGSNTARKKTHAKVAVKKPHHKAVAAM